MHTHTHAFAHVGAKSLRRRDQRDRCPEPGKATDRRDKNLRSPSRLLVATEQLVVVIHVSGRGLLAILVLGLFWSFNNGGLGRHHQARHRRSIADGHAHDAGGVDDASLEHVHVLVVQRIITGALLGSLQHLLHNNRTLLASVCSNLHSRQPDGIAHDGHTRALIARAMLVGEKLLQFLAGAQQSRATASHDALLHRSASRADSVHDTILLLAHLQLGSAAHLDDGHATAQLRQTLLQLFTVVLHSLLLDTVPQKLLTLLHRGRIAAAVQHHCVVLGHCHLLHRAQDGGVKVLGIQLHASVLVSHHLGTSKNGDVLQHTLLVITEARRLDAAHLQLALQLVKDQRRQRLALHVVGDDQKRTTLLGHVVESRKQRLDRVNLLLGYKYVQVLELGLLCLGIRHEVRTHIAALDLHAFHNLQLSGHSLAILRRNDAVTADLVHRLTDHLADLLIAVGRDGGDADNVLRSLDRAGLLQKARLHIVDRDIHTTLHVDRVRTLGNALEALAEDAVHKHRRGRGAVTSQVVRLVAHLAHKLRTHVLKAILELNRLRNSHAILRDLRRAVGLLDNHVSALRPQRCRYCGNSASDALLHGATSVFTKAHILACKTHSGAEHISLCVFRVPVLVNFGKLHTTKNALDDGNNAVLKRVALVVFFVLWWKCRGWRRWYEMLCVTWAYMQAQQPGVQTCV
ncbi:chaperonin HSP60, mitochondrial precursor [Leishmania tarentolae]|uniref:Chaperonin HSP60, mitochondrial n=1 Tax=Leishmania tarentolae TaxID=5689 RepID=A0A640KUR4_LEITA|nr:chaperonin HSP60, mitochondrial precursor [Leishmania tarentolae]